MTAAGFRNGWLVSASSSGHSAAVESEGPVIKFETDLRIYIHHMLGTAWQEACTWLCRHATQMATCIDSADGDFANNPAMR